MTSPEGRLLLILAGRDRQSAAQLATSSGLGPTETARQLQRLVDRGFIIAADPVAGVAIYHLKPRAAQPDELDPNRRILLVESDEDLGELVTGMLEDEGYATIAADAPADAVALLSEVSFDLVITDSFSKTPGAVLVTVGELREAAGRTPVVLFTAHKLEPDAVQAAGFRELIEKPFDIDVFERTIRALLPTVPSGV
jgi:CheY-like chemotaxis protein